MGKTTSRRSPAALFHAKQFEQSFWNSWEHWSEDGQERFEGSEHGKVYPETQGLA